MNRTPQAVFKDLTSLGGARLYGGLARALKTAELNRVLKELREDVQRSQFFDFGYVGQKTHDDICSFVRTLPPQHHTTRVPPDFTIISVTQPLEDDPTKSASLVYHFTKSRHTGKSYVDVFVYNNISGNLIPHFGQIFDREKGTCLVSDFFPYSDPAKNFGQTIVNESMLYIGDLWLYLQFAKAEALDVVARPRERWTETAAQTGNCFFRAYKEVTIKPFAPTTKYERDPDAVPSGVGKAYHLVRTHQRRLRSGKIIPVRAHHRGDKAKGIIEKTYKVDLSAVSAAAAQTP
jgi:hypothetical protein